VNTFELTKHLMSIPSVSGTEGKVGEFLESHLGGLGYRVERQNVAPDRFNVMAYAGAHADVILCTHIDTVPPVLAIREDDEFLYGRGACDTKGIIAAMIEAGERVRRDGMKNFGYLFVIAEETDSSGAKAANTLKWDVKYTIVGEPTENQLVRAQKGALNANLTVKGRAAHSGYPELGVSAIDILLKILADCQNGDWGNDPVLGKGTLNIGVIQGGQRANIVAAEASASIMIRTIAPRTEMEEKLRTIVGNRATMDVVSASDPQILHVVEGFPTTVVSFASDVPHLNNLGKRLMIGPGSILDAHSADEKISKRELTKGVDLYERLMRKLLS
jgi:acetylornithine deacetylase